MICDARTFDITKYFTNMAYYQSIVEFFGYARLLRVLSVLEETNAVGFI